MESLIGALPSVPPWPWWPALLGMAGFGAALVVCDLRSGRLPDRLTVAALGYVLPAVALAAAALGDPAIIGRAAAGAVLWGGGYLLVRLVAPGCLGGGDVKLAPSLGILTASASWSALLVAVFLANAITAVAAGIALLRRRREVPHGPAMVAASLAAALLALG